MRQYTNGHDNEVLDAIYHDLITEQEWEEGIDRLIPTKAPKYQLCANWRSGWRVGMNRKLTAPTSYDQAETKMNELIDVYTDMGWEYSFRDYPTVSRGSTQIRLYVALTATEGAF